MLYYDRTDVHEGIDINNTNTVNNVLFLTTGIF